MNNLIYCLVVTLIILKLAGILPISWVLVFLPLIIPIVFLGAVMVACAFVSLLAALFDVFKEKK